jgi:hypothetical protein
VTVVVERAFSLEQVREELIAASQFAGAAGIDLDASGLSEEYLKFRVTFVSRAGERFFAEFDCSDYPVLPPLIEFTDEPRATRGLHRHYPNVFHNAPCVCMRYSRKAYGERGGPHQEWRMLDWHLATPGGGPIRSLAEIVSDMHAKILDATGRLG